jgi:hypothetical protein
MSDYGGDDYDGGGMEEYVQESLFALFFSRSSGASSAGQSKLDGKS